MITRQELVRDLRSQHKGASWLCVSQIRRYFGLGKDRTHNFLLGMDFYTQGKKKLYHVIDIAKQVEKFKQAG